MNQKLTILITVCFLLFSCDNPKTPNDNAHQTNSANEKGDIAKLNNALKKYEVPSQISKVSADRPSLVTGRKGTKVFINPNDLITESGKPLGRSIEVELKELVNQGQLLRTNAQTVSDKQLLVSGGAYYIGITSNGERLKLKDNKALIVQFPQLSNKEMALFYGQRDDLGQINWQKGTEVFKSTQQKKIIATDSVVTVSKNNKSDLDAIIDYIEDGDTIATPEEKENRVKRQKDYKVSQKVYDEIGIAKLGWINCDRFLEVGEKTDLYASFNPQDSIKNANIYLVFKDINSVIQAYYHSDKPSRFENMPIGYKVRLIAYTVKNEKVFAYSTDLTISKGQQLTLNLTEISDKAFKRLIDN